MPRREGSQRSPFHHSCFARTRRRWTVTTAPSATSAAVRGSHSSVSPATSISPEQSSSIFRPWACWAEGGRMLLAPFSLILALLAVPIILMYVLKLRRQEQIVPSNVL